MGYHKRAILTIKRSPKKYMTLFILVLVLGILAAGAISIQRAIYSTKERLFDQLPAVATIVPNFENREESILEDRNWVYEPLTVETVRKIGALPYVESFQYSLSSRIYSTALSRYRNSSPNPDWGIAPEAIVDYGSLLIENSPLGNLIGGLEAFEIYGVSQPLMAEVETGIIQLVEGRYFEGTEIEQGRPVAWVSQGMAAVNGLTLGSSFTLDSIYFNPGFTPWTLNTSGSEILENAHAHQGFKVQVIGIFEVIADINADDMWQNVLWTQEKLNSIFIPALVVQQHFDFLNENIRAVDGNAVESFNMEPIFFLHDARDLANFSEAANEILGRYRQISDLSGNVESVFGAMETMGWFADIIFYVGIGSSVTILILLILLFLKDRKAEIGLYLALGEKKAKIIIQLLIEVFVVTFMALGLSLMIGNILSSTLSHTMLESDLVRHEREISVNDLTMPVLAWRNPGEVSMEKMLAMYDTSLNSTDIALFFLFGSITLLISTSLPMVYVLRVEPKKVLM